MKDYFSDMVLVHVKEVSPRSKYVMEQLFRQILGVEVELCTDSEKIEHYEGPKLSYGLQPIEGVPFFRSTGFLYEYGIHEQEVRFFEREGLPMLFPVSEPSSLAFDPFAASFFMLARYEEYLPHIKDKHNRFDAEESLAFQKGFLNRPVVDLWALEIRKVLENHFPNFDFPSRKFRFVNTIDVDNAWAYKGKGLMRSLGGFARSLLRMDLMGFRDRLTALIGMEKDPFDSFNYLKSMQEKYGFESVYFFLLADYGLNDKNVPVTNRGFRLLIKSIADYATTGIHPSYASGIKPKKIAVEVERLRDIVHREVRTSRQHFLRLTLPVTYNYLIDLDITDDYTMGYASQVGFRAGTSNAYYFYDLEMEVATSMRIHPFAVMEGTFKYYMNLGPEESKVAIRSLIEEVKAVDGTFISLWHNDSISEYGDWLGWRAVYEYMLEVIYEA
jgi:hypothetical protein